MTAVFARPDFHQALSRLKDRHLLRDLAYCDGRWTSATDNKSFEVTDPASGETREGSEWLRRYSDPFVRGLIARGGHPLFVGRKVGGYIDAWNTEADPGWSLVGTMRYRSRRDLVRMASDPRFRAAHPAKSLGIASTFSFPTQRQIAFYASPRVTVGLALALVAALGHILILTIG